MPAKVGLVLPGVSVLGLAGAYRIGDLFHVFLLAGLMLLLLGLLHARDAARRPDTGATKKSS